MALAGPVLRLWRSVWDVPPYESIEDGRSRCRRRMIAGAAAVVGMAVVVMAAVMLPGRVIKHRRTTTTAPVNLRKTSNVTLAGQTSWCKVGNNEARGDPGDFDYYLLALSWAPEYCHGHSENEAECGRNKHYAFVLHGLWPSWNSPRGEGDYPVCCSNVRVSDETARGMDSLMIDDDGGFAKWEWMRHGTCSGQSPENFFTTVRTAFASIKLPTYTNISTQLSARTSSCSSGGNGNGGSGGGSGGGSNNGRKQTRASPADVEQVFLAVNDGRLPEESVVVACGRGPYLSEVHVCLDKKSLKPIRCTNLALGGQCRIRCINVVAPN